MNINAEKSANNGEDRDFDILNINTDENVAGDQHLTEPMEEESEAEKLKTQLAEAADRYLRQAAEFENYKRRTSRERIELMQTAGKEIITELLPVLDDSERAQKGMEATDDLQQLKEGISLIFNKLRSTLTAKGLRPMETLNQKFNADLHEAIAEVEAGPNMKGKVVDEITKGYYLNDKIIRFAQVVVGK